MATTMQMDKVAGEEICADIASVNPMVTNGTIAAIIGTETTQEIKADQTIANMHEAAGEMDPVEVEAIVIG